MNICVLIPVHNESKTIGHLVQEIRKRNFDILVIDDGSEDDSGSIAVKREARLIHHASKKGKGISLREGFDYVLGKNYTGVITMDGDGQHDVEDIDTFVKVIEQHPESVITGSRMDHLEDMPIVRRITNRSMSWFISMICKQHVPDTQCGFRYISTKILREIELKCKDFEIETEVLIKASKKGFKIISVPIKTIYRNEASKINPFLDTVKFFTYILKEMFSSYGR